MSNENFNLGATLPTLAGERVRLRWLTAEDIPVLFNIFGDAEVTRYWGHAILPDTAAAAMLLRRIHEGFERKRLFQWGVALSETDALLGTCTLASLDAENRRADLGFALARPYWGQGYMADALRVLLRFAFSDLQMRRLTADADPRNARSIRVLERLGFRREGYLREHYLLHGELQDSILFGLLHSEWLG